MTKKTSAPNKQKTTLSQKLEGVPVYGKILIFLPIALVLSGGLVGGACGGLAIWINLKYWNQNISTASKIAISISSLIGAAVLSVVLATLILGALK